ncbi:MAG TPA: gluconate 2-dehydrogenase subunit 3 family protein [Candidatus Bathyarchaeia archaeon]|nr:gluconate 2-dehydrogenase subunit 3 family protein [Candidatus Bathyarchaeia archaeon]
MSEGRNDRGFSKDELETLACVLDHLVPASEDGKLPGAGRVGVAAVVDEALHRMPEVRGMVAQGLSALEALAGRRSSRAFATLPRDQQAELLNELAASEHAFPPILLLHVYNGYYQQGPVLEALGLEPRPPHPLGYEMKPNDLRMLDRVRRRGRLYRDC